MTGMLSFREGLGREHGHGGVVPAGRGTGCPLCGSHEDRTFRRTRDFNWDMPGEFTYVTCTRCGLVRQSPAPSKESLPGLYPRFYGASGTCGGEPDAGNSLPPFHFRANILEALKPPPASLLDIGCGNGLFLAFMRRRGWDVSGIEAAGEHVEYAHRVLGLNGVRHASWPTDSIAGMQVDVVSFIHVLEHFFDPIEALERAYRIMKPGALLVLETPNVNGWPLMLFGRYCVQVDAPRHLWLFTPAALHSCVRKAGYEPVLCRTCALATMDWTESLRYVLATAGLRSYGRRSAPGEGPAETGQTGIRTTARSLLQGLHTAERALCRGLNRISGWSGQGANILMIARKA